MHCAWNFDFTTPYYGTPASLLLHLRKMMDFFGVRRLPMRMYSYSYTGCDTAAPKGDYHFQWKQ